MSKPLPALAVGAVLRRVPGAGRSVTVARLINLVARLAWELTLRRGGDWTYVAKLRSGAMVELRLEDRLQAMTWLTGAYEARVGAELAAALPVGGVMFDVGANVGLVTFEVAGRCGATSSFHCFEPFPANANAIRVNCDLNPELEVHVVESAVGRATGIADLAVSTRPGESGHHSLATGGGGSDSEAVHDRLQVPLISLDHYVAELGIPHVHVLKIDVEGAEADVLAGAEGLLREGRVDLVLMEVNDRGLNARGLDEADLVSQMKALGYRSRPLPSEFASALIPRRFRNTVSDVVFERDRPDVVLVAGPERPTR